VALPAADATAYGERTAPFILNIVASTPASDGYDESVDWARATHAALGSALTGSTYVNFASDEGDVHEAYAPSTYERLVALKNEYDPTNVFRLNQNVVPAT
jgi:FAD/FMN-containing dehydrogenase